MFSKGVARRNKKTMLFYRYMLSYILFVVVILIIVSTIVNGKIIYTLQGEVESSNMTSLQQIRSTMDTRLKEMEKTAIHISSNPVLIPFVLATGENNALVNGIKELGHYKTNNTFLYEIAVHYNYGDTNNIYTSIGVFSLDMFFDKVYRYDNFNKKDYISMLDTIKYPVIRSVETIRLNGYNDMNFATYIYPLPVNTSKPYGAVMFMIKEDVLKSIVGDIFNNYSGYVYILNDKNEPILSIVSDKVKNNYNDFINNIKFDFIKDNAISNLTIGGDRYSIAKLSSDYNGWKYVAVMPTAQLMEKIDNIRLVFHFSIVIIFALGITIAFFFANNNYRPFKRLLDAVQGQVVGSTPAEHRNEVDFILNVINEATVKNQGLISELKSKSGMIREQLLLALLNGKINHTDDILYMMDISNMELKEPYFAVMLFLIDEYESFKKENNLSMQDILKFSIINVLEELASELGIGYGIDLMDDRGVALVLNLKDGYNKHKYLSDLGTKTKEFFKKHFEFTLTVGVGNIYDDITMIQASYAEARSAANYRLIKGNDTIICFKDLSRNCEGEYKYILEQEKQLVLYIKRGQINSVQSIIDDIINNIRYKELPIQIVQYTHIVILNVVLNVIKEMKIEDDHYINIAIEDLISTKFETLDDLGNQLKNLCKMVCDCIENKKDNKNAELCEAIMTYVKQNYNNNNMYVDNLARIFKLSDSYITRIFKEYTGYSLKQYIDMIRINKAKELLVNTDLTLDEIICLVGYVDKSNFIRKFKKDQGITPIVYRDINKSYENTIESCEDILRPLQG